MEGGKLPKADARDSDIRGNGGSPAAARVRLGRGRRSAGCPRLGDVGEVSGRVRVVQAEGGLLHVLAVQALAVFVEAFDEAFSSGLLGREDRPGVIVL